MTDGPDDGGPLPPVPLPEAVTDEDRNRYGVLLDRAAERGLLGPDDYEIRLRELAAASSVEQMNRIVTELPAFSAAAGSLARSGPSFPAVPARSAIAAPGGRRRSSPWLLLVVVVAVIAASLLFLSLYAGHLTRDRNSGLAPSASRAVTFSVLRL